MKMSDARHELRAWDRFWFEPEPVFGLARLRGALCVITALYFISAWADAAFWYAEGGPFSPINTSRFWQTANLQDEASWNLSPLFLTASPWVYQAYLVVGMVLSVIVFAGRGGRVAAFALWLFVVGWANRAMILSGLAETMLSLGLFAAAIAPASPAWAKAGSPPMCHWTTRLANRLTAVQITVVGLLTTATMLGGRIWFNGLGAYALAAPKEDRTIDWTGDESWLLEPFVHETLTHLIVVALPLGLCLAWNRRTSTIGKAIVVGWCVVIASLGSLWLYAATFAVMALAIKPLGLGRSGDPAERTEVPPAST